MAEWMADVLASKVCLSLPLVFPLSTQRDRGYPYDVDGLESYFL